MIYFKAIAKSKGIANGNVYITSQTENVRNVKVKRIVNYERSKTNVK
jgi:hypothetical protein